VTVAETATEHGLALFVRVRVSNDA